MGESLPRNTLSVITIATEGKFEKLVAAVEEIRQIQTDEKSDLRKATAKYDQWLRHQTSVQQGASEWYQFAEEELEGRSKGLQEQHLSEEDFQRIDEIISKLGQKIETIALHTAQERSRARVTVQSLTSRSSIQRFSQFPTIRAQERAQIDLMAEKYTDSLTRNSSRNNEGVSKVSDKISSPPPPLKPAFDVGKATFGQPEHTSKAQCEITDVKVDHPYGEPSRAISFSDGIMAQLRSPFTHVESGFAARAYQWANGVVGWFIALFSETILFGGAPPVWGVPVNRAKLSESALLLIDSVRRRLNGVQHSEGVPPLQMVIGAILIAYVFVRLWLCWMDERVPEGFMYVDTLRSGYRQ